MPSVSGTVARLPVGRERSVVSRRALVVCVLRGGVSRVEQTLLDGGRGTAVIQQRMEFQDLMCDRFTALIEDATGRKVIGFMNGNQHHPDIMCEVFVLAPTDLVDPGEIGSGEIGAGEQASGPD